MKIELQKITVRELTKGYQDNEEQGVIGYNGQLDIRPPYQREFIYNDKQREAVITTIKKGFPLNVMYWARREEDSPVPFEVLDGQQRTISVCQYVNGDFSYVFQYFHNLTKAEQDQILDYELMVYVCSGDDKEKLDWFKTINIAGEKLTDQELRNAVYAGPFVSDAKKYFSKNNCAAYNIGKDLINGTPNRQDYMETALKWIARSQSTPLQRLEIESYMAKHQHDSNALQLWQYFQSVITWVTGTFDLKKRKDIMKGVDWGELYDKFHKVVLNKSEIDVEVGKLLIDSEVQAKKGICPYVLTREEKWLNLRSFPDDIKMAVFEKQHHKCANPKCPDGGKEFEYNEMEGDHITPWIEGGKTVIENCQMLCKHCNRVKGKK